jgi:hypothetical protein
MKTNTMRKLRVKMLKNDVFENDYVNRYAGQTGTVTHVTQSGYGCGSVWATVKLDHSGITLVHLPLTLLEPLDVSMVPESHSKSLLLKQIWVFFEAANDAWHRGPPSDLAKFQEEFGKPWEDIRTYDVARA